MRARGTAVVRVTHRITDDECGVGADDLRGGELAMGHLLALGHERVGYVTSASHVWPTDERREGVLIAARKDGKSDDVLHDISVEHLNVAHGRDAGERILGVRPRPTAVICANDLVALGVLQVMIRHGVRVPDDMAIVGFDDIEFASAAAIPLTSVRLPRRFMGRTRDRPAARGGERRPRARAPAHRAGAGARGQAVDDRLIENAGPPPVQPGPEPRRVARRADVLERVHAVQHGVERRRGVVEDGHHAVAQALDDLAAMLVHRLLDRASHLAQQRERRIVAGVERPGREVDEIGEDDRQLRGPATAPLRLGDVLPDLQRAQAGLAQQSRPAAVTSASRRPNSCQARGPPVESGSPNAGSPGSRHAPP